MEPVESLVSNIESKMEAFKADAQKGLKGNATAARRARVMSNEITKMFKEYSKLSVESAA